MNHEMMEYTTELRALIAEGWKLQTSLKAMYNDLEVIHAKLASDVDDINKARGYSHNKEAPKLPKLTVVKTDSTTLD